MAIENTQNFNDSPEKGPVDDLSGLQAKYRNMVELSSAFTLTDKKSAIDFLKSDEGKDRKALQGCIDTFHEAEQSVGKLVQDYKTQLTEECAAGRFAKKSVDAYRKWFEGLSYTEKAKYIKEKSSDLHNPKRKELLDIFNGKEEFDGVRIPEAVRREYKGEFLSADMEERESLIRRLAKRHKELKSAFLKLPKEIQEKFREKFKASTLRERERLLKSMGAEGIENKTDKSPEEAENRQLIKDYDEKMISLIRENLFSPLSMKAYQEWFRALPLAEKRKNLQRSDLNGPEKLKERITVRDTFMALDPAAQKKNGLRFRNADLEGRKAILAGMNQTVSKGSTNSYPENIMRHTLEQAMESPRLAQTRMLYTEMKEVATLRRRAEIRYESRKAEGIAQKAANDDKKIDPMNVLYIEDLKAHQERRFGLKRHLIAKRAEGQNAVETGAVLVNRQKQEVTAETFQQLIVGHLKSEFVAGVVNAAAERLPRANRVQLGKVAEKLDPTVDLYKTVA